MARSIGLATCSVTSAAPAPGYGATTVTIGNDTSGRSSCFKLPHARTPAIKRAAASRSVTLRLTDRELAEAVHILLPGMPADAVDATLADAASAMMWIARGR